jgi:hypothetical protein
MLYINFLYNKFTSVLSSRSPRQEEHQRHHGDTIMAVLVMILSKKCPALRLGLQLTRVQGRFAAASRSRLVV